MITSEKGSATIETTIIFSCVLMCLIAIVYALIFYFNQVKIKAIADEAAIYAAKIYVNSKLSEKDKKQKVENFILAAIKKEIGLKRNRLDIGINIKDYIIYKNLYIEIKTQYGIPLAKILKPIGFNDKFAICQRALITINEPTNLIRNTDFLIDVAKEVDNKSGEKISTAVTEVLKKLEYFKK